MGIPPRVQRSVSEPERGGWGCPEAGSRATHGTNEGYGHHFAHPPVGRADARAGPRHRALRRPHAPRPERSRRDEADPGRAAGRAQHRPGAGRLRLSHARARRLPPGQRHGHRGRVAGRRAAHARSAGSTPTTAAPAPRPSARSRPAPRASSCTRAPSSSPSTIPPCASSPRSPTSASCPSSSTPAAGSRRSASTPWSWRARSPAPGSSSPTPGVCDLSWIWRVAADHPNLHVRHGVVDAGRPAGAVRARAARARSSSPPTRPTGTR